MTTPSSSRRRTILVVDDDPSILGVLVDILTDEGFVVHAETDPRQALARALAAPPDLILTDLMMPHLDGRAVLERLRHQPVTAAIPVLLMSAAGHVQVGDAFAAFIAKPFTIDALLATLERHLP